MFSNLTQDGINQCGPSLLKRVDVTGKAFLQLPSEFFNVLQHPIFPSRNTTATNASLRNKN